MTDDDDNDEDDDDDNDDDDTDHPDHPDHPYHPVDHGDHCDHGDGGTSSGERNVEPKTFPVITRMTSVPPNKMLFQQFFWRYNVYIRELIVRSGEMLGYFH